MGTHTLLRQRSDLWGPGTTSHSLSVSVDAGVAQGSAPIYMIAKVHALQQRQQDNRSQLTYVLAVFLVWIK
jgi:hypothetical protein